jgi:hypothetical protein
MVARVRASLPAIGLGLLALAGCPAPGSDTSTSTGPPLTTTGDEPTGTGTTDACMGSGDCDSEGICVADYEAADTMPPSGGMRSPAACAPETACIAELDLSRWCFDHRSCCDDLRCRPADGVCEPALLGQTTGATDADTTGTGTDTTGTTGTDSTSTGDGTDTSTGDTGSTGTDTGSDTSG